ncbi:hypothetical protein ACH5RR_030003 [Cinchona calisaya]|uniref:Uncharacterized protein n=1 Tax=Cinchona calisaya TaxID=153742 RepID=A0ABD2YXM9_9GENT
MPDVTSYDESPGHSVDEREFEMRKYGLDYSGMSYFKPETQHVRASENANCEEFYALSPGHSVHESDLIRTEYEIEYSGIHTLSLRPNTPLIIPMMRA